MFSTLRQGMLLSTLCGVVFALAGCQVSNEADLQRLINEYGFSRNVPASTLYGPGALVARERYDPKESLPPKSVQLADLCIHRYSVDLYASKPNESPLESIALGSKIGGSFTVSAPALKGLFNLSVTSKLARTVTATISDTKVYQFSEEDLQDIRKLLGPTCRSIVNDNLAKKNAYQVVRVLQATLDLKVDLDTSISASAKAKVVKELLDVGFTLDPDSNTVAVKGRALYYGIVVEPLSGRV
jgi:hypothetical protein